MTQTGSVSSGEIYNAQVTLAGGKVWSDEFINYKRGGFRIASNVNGVALDDIELTFTLESWDGILNEWIPEPQALFEAHPTGAAESFVDTFTTTQAEKYRVGMEPTGGTTGFVHMSVSEQTEE